MRVLNEEGERLREEFERDYRDSCCYCHLCAPCSYCVHEGNPNNLAESDDLWIEVPDEEEPKVDVMDVTRRMFR